MISPQSRHTQVPHKWAHRAHWLRKTQSSSFSFLFYYSQWRCIFLRRYPFGLCPKHTHTGTENETNEWPSITCAYTQSNMYIELFTHTHTHVRACPQTEILSHFWHILLVLSVRKSHVHYAHSHLSVRHCIAVGILAGHIGTVCTYNVYNASNSDKW